MFQKWFCEWDRNHWVWVCASVFWVVVEFFSCFSLFVRLDSSNNLFVVFNFVSSDFWDLSESLLFFSSCCYKAASLLAVLFFSAWMIFCFSVAILALTRCNYFLVFSVAFFLDSFKTWAVSWSFSSWVFCFSKSLVNSAGVIWKLLAKFTNLVLYSAWYSSNCFLYFSTVFSSCSDKGPKFSFFCNDL